MQSVLSRRRVAYLCASAQAAARSRWCATRRAAVADCGGGGVKVRLGVRVSGEGSAAARVCAEARWSGWRHAATTRNISSSRARVLSAPSAAGVGRGTAGVKGGSSQGKGGFRVSGVFLPDLRGGSGVVMMYEAHVQHRGSPPAAPAARPATAPVHARWKQREGKGRRPGVWVCTEPNGWAGSGSGLTRSMAQCATSKGCPRCGSTTAPSQRCNTLWGWSARRVRSACSTSTSAAAACVGAAHITRSARASSAACSRLAAAASVSGEGGGRGAGGGKRCCSRDNIQGQANLQCVSYGGNINASAQRLRQELEATCLFAPLWS